MFNRKQVVLAGAVLAAMPLVSKAVTITYQFDPNDLVYSADGAFDDSVPLVNTGTTANPIVTVPVSATGQIGIGVDADVTGNANPASGAAYDNAHATKQAANLGFVSYQVGLSDSKASVAAVTDNGSGGTTATVDPIFVANSAAGNLDGAGGVSVATGTAGTINLAGKSATTAGAIANTDYGANAFAEIFSGMAITAKAAGTAVFSLLDQDGALQYAHNVNSGSGGTTAANAPTYTNQTYNNPPDVLSALPTLTVNVTGVVTGHPIVALTAASGGAPTLYGTSQGTLTVTGSNGSYKPASKVLSPAVSAGYVEGKTFTPATDTEIYALDVTTSGGAQDNADAAIIASQITGTGIVASTTPPSPAFASTGTYNLYVTFSGAGVPSGDNFFGFDLSQATGIAAGDTISAVALVPEPASAAFLLVGSAGMLMGRRKRMA